MNKVYFDTETTGFKPGHITQLAALVEDSNYNLVGAHNYFFSIDKELSQEIQSLTGLSKDKLNTLSHNTKFKDHAAEIVNIFANNISVAHNEQFDSSFLLAETQRCNLVIPNYKGFCTMEYFRSVCKIPKARGYGYKNPKVSEVLKSLSISEEKVLELARYLFRNTEFCENLGFHDARFDTTAIYVASKVHAEMQLNKLDGYWIKSFTHSLK